MQFSVFVGEVCQYCVQAEDTKNVIKIKVRQQTANSHHTKRCKNEK